MRLDSVRELFDLLVALGREPFLWGVGYSLGVLTGVALVTLVVWPVRALARRRAAPAPPSATDRTVAELERIAAAGKAALRDLAADHRRRTDEVVRRATRHPWRTDR